MKGMVVEIYRSRWDGTNGGVTSPGLATKGTALLVGPGIPRLSEPSDDEPMLLLVKGLGGQKWRAIPADPVPEGHHGWMMGGNFLYTSDSRFREAIGEQLVLPVHDHSYEVR